MVYSQTKSQNQARYQRKVKTYETVDHNTVSVAHKVLYLTYSPAVVADLS